MDCPITKFNVIWKKALQDSPLKQKSAVCISTIDANGFPQSRFVDLKSADNNGFIFCTYLDSNKGKEIQDNPKVSLTIWWDHIGMQIRIAGQAEKISEQLSTEFWYTRSRDAKLTTTSFNQSQPLSCESELDTRFELIKQQMQNQEVPKPDNWGGYVIKPLSIEFLTFKESRLHLRELYQSKNEQWQKSLLQP
ncbi:pyridoxal 5'-phosphate synthase [Pseudoalteromonas sp. C2R02]|uniref:pyridoxine/pyridoxamine 5'-phosphate oxidase n=1 Tax=Pseudoalteromonas sp. C2R02 TaxID=2841565 RepID=UPI001C097E0B|nr:pyridoxal 5'-phosphate synthase [Pseudoalteromonas sp. C2R02]MBU2972530.1 pyridoxal 5'-phosphate synthase [Pseudoalteromonas sp. C2R02]